LECGGLPPLLRRKQLPECVFLKKDVARTGSELTEKVNSSKLL
jgi:hypothetical protein